MTVAPTSRGDFGRVVLFLCVFSFYWITLTPFVDRTVDPANAKPAWWSLIVTIGIFLVLLAYALRAPLRPIIAQPRTLLIAIFGWLMLTAALGDDPLQAMRRVAIAMTVCISASAILLLPRDERHFARLLSIVVLLVLGLCYLGALLLPNLSIHQATDFLEPEHAGLWRGIYTHKNTAAPVMVLSCFAGLYLMRSWSRLGGLMIIAAAAVFLLNTGSKTSIAMLVAVLVLGAVFERWRALRAPIALGGVALINLGTLGVAVFEPVRNLIASSGIDSTFTARSDIWQLAFEAIAERPLTGHGFQSFWQADSLVQSDVGTHNWAVVALNAHNAYLDAAVTAGIPGLALILVWLLFAPLNDINGAGAAANAPLTRFFIRVWLFCIFTACLESLFLSNSGPVWFTMLVAVFGLRYQARYSVKAQAPAPGSRVHSYA